MKLRITRAVILALMLLALAPGAALASCLMSGPDDCCCSGCPVSDTTKIDATPCCEMTDGAKLPEPTPLALTPLQPETVVTALAAAALDVADRAPRSAFDAANHVVEPPAAVPLFTLHAAFLI